MLRELGREGGNIVTKKSFIKFEELPWTGKTQLWSVRSATDSKELGRVGWFTSWRKYVFFANGTALFDQACLQEITDFLVEQNRLYKDSGKVVTISADEITSAKQGRKAWEIPPSKINGRGIKVKLHNRRVSVFPTDSGVVIICKRLGGENEPRVVTTKLPLTDDAAIAISGLIEEIIRDKYKREKAQRAVNSIKRNKNG